MKFFFQNSGIDKRILVAIAVIGGVLGSAICGIRKGRWDAHERNVPEMLRLFSALCYAYDFPMSSETK